MQLLLNLPSDPRLVMAGAGNRKLWASGGEKKRLKVWVRHLRICGRWKMMTMRALSRL